MRAAEEAAQRAEFAAAVAWTMGGWRRWRRSTTLTTFFRLNPNIKPAGW